MHLPRNSSNLHNAKKMRKNLTPQERHLWYDFLRYCKPRFRRQELIGNYIADFYCYDAKLIVEIDGSQHYEENEKIKDLQRTAYFHTLGLKILRFSNADINTRFERVCNAIILALKQCGVTAEINFEG